MIPGPFTGGSGPELFSGQCGDSGTGTHFCPAGQLSCPKRILHFAYAFSREYFEKHQNSEIPLVQPQAGGEEGTEPEILHCASERDETEQVADWLEEASHALCGHWSMAVLCPASFQ